MRFGNSRRLREGGGVESSSLTSEPTWLGSISLWAGWLIAGSAILILIGWFLHLSRLLSVFEGLPKIVPATAFGFLVTGLGLMRSKRLGLPAGVVTLLWGILGLSKAFFGWPALDAFPLQLWIDQDGLGGSSMSPATATSFVLLGLAFLASKVRQIFGLFQLLVLATILLAMISVSRYLYGGEPLIAFAHMSIPTTLLFFVAGVSTLTLRPDGGLVRLLLAPSEGGALLRRLILPTAAIPPVVGVLCRKGEHAGLYGSEAGLALFTLSSVILFGAVAWWAALGLDRVDRARTQAERRNHLQLERLQLLHQITRATAERQDPASIFQVAIRSLEDHLPVDFGCACIHHPESQTLEVVAIGLKGLDLARDLALPERSTFAVDPNGLERCMQGELVYKPDVSKVAMPFPQRLAAGGLQSLVLVPLQAEKQVFGLLAVARREASSFTSGECEFLRQLGESVALASYQAELNHSLRRAYFDLRETQQMVLQQERLRSLGEMASGIAHDINNAIAPAALHTETLLERETGLTEQGRGHLQTVNRAVHDVAQTVARLQELYRRRELQQATKPMQLNVLVEQVLDLTRSKWRDMPQEKGLVIEVLQHLAPDLPLVRGVESEIREALTNLIFNAVDAMPDGGLLTIRTCVRGEVDPAPSRHQAGRILLEVGDTGTGMDEETRRRCLEPFFTTKGERGSGLGLPMVFSVAQRHDAEVEIESELGRGTLVRLSFPWVPFEVMPSAEEVEARASSLKILVVDDDPVLIETLCDVLAGDGHQVTPAPGGAAGIEAFETALAGKAPFDLVLTDLGMPKVDGRRVAAAIKGTSPSTPIILLTGWGHGMEEGELPVNVDLVLAKPPRLKDLRKAIAQCS